jgi:hypothetical protein
VTCVTPHKIFDVMCAEASVAPDTYMLLRHATLGPRTMRVLLPDASGRLGDRPLRRRWGRQAALIERRPPHRSSGFRLRTGPCRALGADTPRDAKVRGDLACRRLRSERKYVKRIYARDTGKAGRQFAR